MNFRQGYINIHKKVKETGETRGKRKKKENDRKKERENSELAVFGGHRISIFVSTELDS